MHTCALSLPLRAIIFDFDGTLSKSPLSFSTMREKVRDAITPYVLLPLERPDLLLLEEIQGATLSLPPALAQQIVNIANTAIEEYEIEIAKKSKLFPSVRSMLQQGKEKGFLFGSITRNCKQAIDIIFPDALDYCEVVVTRDDVRKVKPDPEHILAALHSMQCTPQNTLMVGDHPLDIVTGKCVGAYTAAVGTGEGTKEVLLACEPTLYCDDVLELANILQIFL